MLFIYLSTQSIKVLHLKKSLLGQYDTSFSEKNLQVDLLENGIPKSPDVIASGLKETIGILTAQSPIKEKDVTLILPQECFTFFSTDLPLDITESVLTSYVQEKARTEAKVMPESVFSDYIISECENQKKILYYSIDKTRVDTFVAPFRLLDLKIVAIIPETLAYFKLFEKTLRQNKKENIWYLSYNDAALSSYCFDSFGLKEPEKWQYTLGKKDKIEEVLQKKALEYAKRDVKLNRLILAGTQADTVRQDTFTKNVGVWTNPLKRIITHFYTDYLKMLGSEGEKQLPILSYDVLIGAFIFISENKTFSLMKTSTTMGAAASLIPSMSSLPMSKPKIQLGKLPMRGIIFFIISFIVTFAALFGLSQIQWKTGSFAFNMPAFPDFFASPTPTPSPIPTKAPPTPTPKPELKRDTVKVKILNGSGIAGKASVVKDFLKEKGYLEILTANADSFDYETTVVQVKKGKSEIQELMVKDISTEISKPKVEVLPEDDAADVIIIVGTDFK